MKIFSLTKKKLDDLYFFMNSSKRNVPKLDQGNINLMANIKYI